MVSQLDRANLQAVEWLDSIKEYIALNPHVKGFPENDKAVYEM